VVFGVVGVVFGVVGEGVKGGKLEGKGAGKGRKRREKREKRGKRKREKGKAGKMRKGRFWWVGFEAGRRISTPGNGRFTNDLLIYFPRHTLL
jgi:hypothetical protein